MKILSMQRLDPRCSIANGRKFPIGSGAHTQPAVQARRQPHAAGQRNHGPVVRAKFGARQIELRAQVPHDSCEPFAQSAIRAHAAGHDQALMTRQPKGASALFRQRLDYGFLEAARHIGADGVAQFAAAQGY
jgi:hypothetical protein